jgi:hypothetical protein
MEDSSIADETNKQRSVSNRTNQDKHLQDTERGNLPISIPIQLTR